MKEQSLYERLGGVNAIAMVVDRFSDEIVKNAKLNVNPALKEWKQIGQIARPQVHAHTLDMPSDGRALSIQWQRTGREIDRALNYFRVPERERQEVLAAIVAKKTEVVRSFPGKIPV